MDFYQQNHFELQDLTDIIGSTDIYLIDQIMKGRYLPNQNILDAGCGTGRNLYWFIKNELSISAVDRDSDAISILRQRYPQLNERFVVANLENMPYDDNFFDHIISSAVLHFANNTDHFYQLLSEHVRVLRNGGTIFIRMTSDIGLKNAELKSMGLGVYQIPDGSTRFLIRRGIYTKLKSKFNFTEIEPIKTTNVNDLRSMTTLVLRKGI
jgi:ubiquinone/menaquinone biosynthesis C-methylase UbiE